MYCCLLLHYDLKLFPKACGLQTWSSQRLITFLPQVSGSNEKLFSVFQCKLSPLYEKQSVFGKCCVELVIRAEQYRGSKGLFLKVGHDQTFLFSSYDNDKPVRELFKEHEALTGLGFFNQYASKAGLTRFERLLRQVVFIMWRLWRFFDQIVEQWVTSKFFV